ncbi:MAG: 50S ribosomal protein L24 [Candidatus Omnitrophica bacterium]|nr:50S ribosomal protein L24 [Candidatus Omnitrophota bacterium]
MSLHLKKGDKIMVLAGKDKNKTGKILRMNYKKNTVLVEGVNLVKKHMRRRSEADPGGIKEIPIPIQVSNIALLCSHCNRGVRFHTKLLDKKGKVRVCSRCQKEI